MGGLFTTLFAKIASVVEWVGKLWVAIFVAAWDILRDCFAWVLEEMMKLVVAAVGTLDISGITTNLGAWGQVPAEVMNILGLLGVGTAIAIISAAIGIRLLLQLIPFTRLGS
jgi:hypothetical protein